MAVYGVLSDFHQVDLRSVPPVIQHLKDAGVEALVLNGDLMGERSGYNPQDYLATLLYVAGESGLETYVQPGSHETVAIFEPVIAHFAARYGNIINTFDNPKIEKPDHHLLFLQGSDWRPGDALEHGYSLESINKSGIYKVKDGYLRVISMTDLKGRVTAPERTIVFCHVPAKFAFPGAVDVAEFYEVTESFTLGSQVFEAGSVLPMGFGKPLADQGAPILYKVENRGNEDLGILYGKLGITKAVSGHFHESAGNSHDLQSAVPEGQFSETLFCNASCMDRMIIGLVAVKENKASYKKIK